MSIGNRVFIAVFLYLFFGFLTPISADPASATITISPAHVYADGVQQAAVLVTNIRDENGLPVPDGVSMTLTMQSSGLGTIEGGTPNPFNPAFFKDFVIDNNSIIATYRSADLGLSAGQTVSASVRLYPLEPDGRPRTYYGPTATGTLTLIGKGSATVTASPDVVYSDGIQTSTIVITDIVDALGNPVPDGEVCALAVQSSALGTIEGGTPNPFNPTFYQDFVIDNNSIVATYRSADLALRPGQTVTVAIRLYPLEPDGRPRTYYGPTSTGYLTLTGKGSATVTASPDLVYADGIQTSTVTITDIRDSLGNPVPDGEVCALAVQSSALGTIEGGTPNPFNPAFYQDFVIDNNSIVATYRSADLALRPGQTVRVSIRLYPLEPSGRPLTYYGPAATGSLTLTGKGSATVTASPDVVYADGIQTSTIMITDILDSLGNPVPDGEVCALAVQSSGLGTIEGGTPNPFNPAFYQDFVIDDNSIVATYISPDLGLSPGQIVPVSIRLYPLQPDGRPLTYRGPAASGLLTLVGIQDRDSDSIPDDEDNCPDTYNPLQEDLDGDGIGDVCDPDDDGDQVPDGVDNCPINANPGQEDYDIDGIGNACDDVFSADGIVADLEVLIHQMRDIIVSADPPGGKGMIAKLTANGGVLSKASQAIYGFADGSIDIDTYVTELHEALDMLDAFDNQLSAKRSNGQIPGAEGETLEELSGLVRALIELLQAAVGG